MSEQQQTLFDIGDAAKYLQSLGAKAASINFIRTIISTGQVPHLRVGKKFYIAKSALDRWVDTREKRR